MPKTKRKRPEPDSNVLTVRLLPEQTKKVFELSNKTGITFSALVRVLLLKGMDRTEEELKCLPEAEVYLSIVRSSRFRV